ncbi:AraC family transcriptional regulator [Sugiyamaella lignohabitans]|uniref:AraC family transcriptional regulator n=1 Tax=Sugiyamaella lignohabitans TaxID=796027 RepID=A0A167C0L6_9ASCO|nr:AraC family transcriptional regulator [Sugiyamaella lignohabitans]ANB11066.1 AraC family transcriptional regulator [Sugiyamaella lignohabitans]
MSDGSSSLSSYASPVTPSIGSKSTYENSFQDIDTFRVKLLCFMDSEIKKRQFLDQIRGRCSIDLKALVEWESPLTVSQKKVEVEKLLPDGIKDDDSVSPTGAVKWVTPDFVVVPRSPKRIFCRPHCPSRKHKPLESVRLQFPKSIYSAMKDYGLAPCGRCRPLDSHYLPAQSRLLQSVELMKEKGYKAKLIDLARKAGMSKHHYDRSFSAKFELPPGKFQKMKLAQLSKDEEQIDKHSDEPCSAPGTSSTTSTGSDMEDAGDFADFESRFKDPLQIPSGELTFFSDSEPSSITEETIGTEEDFSSCEMLNSMEWFTNYTKEIVREEVNIAVFYNSNEVGCNLEQPMTFEPESDIFSQGFYDFSCDFILNYN